MRRIASARTGATESTSILGEPLLADWNGIGDDQLEKRRGLDAFDGVAGENGMRAHAHAARARARRARSRTKQRAGRITMSSTNTRSIPTSPITSITSTGLARAGLPTMAKSAPMRSAKARAIETPPTSGDNDDVVSAKPALDQVVGNDRPCMEVVHRKIEKPWICRAWSPWSERGGPRLR